MRCNAEAAYPTSPLPHRADNLGRQCEREAREIVTLFGKTYFYCPTCADALRGLRANPLSALHYAPVTFNPMPEF